MIGYARQSSVKVAALLLLPSLLCEIVSSFQVADRRLPLAGIVRQTHQPLQQRSLTVLLHAKKKRRTKRLDSSGTSPPPQVPTTPPLEPVETQQPAKQTESIPEPQIAASEVVTTADRTETQKEQEETKPKEETEPVEAATAVEENVISIESEAVETESPSAAEETTPKAVELKPRQQIAVSIPVTDVRDVVAGKVLEPPSVPTVDSSVSKPPPATVEAKKETLESIPAASNAGSSDLNDSLQMLLADARQMKALEEKGSAEEETGFSVSKSVKSVISTIVTIDFFVVCVFLLWFLAGVFGSYVLKNDSIQIAFNSIFQPVVQPALGILMIAAISDAVFKQKDKEEEN